MTHLLVPPLASGTSIIVSATYGGFAAMHLSYSYALTERLTSSKREESLLWKLDVGVTVGSPKDDKDKDKDKKRRALERAPRMVEVSNPSAKAASESAKTPGIEAKYGTSQATASGTSTTVLTQAVNSATVLTIVGVPSLPPRYAPALDSVFK